jgi:hypothetical protein
MSTDLVWISSSTSGALTDRSKVRRETMRQVALRRKAAPKQHHPNARQLPVFISSTPEKDTASKSSSSPPQEPEFLHRGGRIRPLGPDFDINAYCSPTTLMPSLVSAGTYPTMLARCNLDCLDLSLLASLEVGRYTGQRLLESPRNLSHFLQGKNWSYFHHVPLYYGESVIIRNATDCVVSRVRCLLSPTDTDWESLAISSYSKALSTLQKAIDCTAEYPSAEVLCATQILGLYEVCSIHRFLAAAY